MNYIIFGGTGFIGTHLANLIADEYTEAKIYNLDAYPVSVCRWTELPNVRRYFEFFMEHKDEFGQ